MAHIVRLFSTPPATASQFQIRTPLFRRLPFSLLQLKSLRHAEKFINRMQPRKIIALHAHRENPFLPDIDIEKPQQRSEKGSLMRQASSAAAATRPPHAAGFDADVPARCRCLLQRHPRLPVRVAIVLLHEHLDRRKRVVIHLRLQPPRLCPGLSHARALRCRRWPWPTGGQSARTAPSRC